jgi:hypothetical protein
MLIKSLIYIVGGSLFWSFSEYALHNWYGHKAKGKNEFSREHLAHHADTSYFAANWKKALATVKVSPFIFVIMSYLTGLFYGSIFTAGFLLTYFTYELIHREFTPMPPAMLIQGLSESTMPRTIFPTRDIIMVLLLRYGTYFLVPLKNMKLSGFRKIMQ